jgi:AraC-like DNA-binding protein
MRGGASALLHLWRHTCHTAGGSLVLPDGCLDVIGLQRPGQAPPRWKISNLMDHAERVSAPAGTRYLGYRLKAGAQINRDHLLKAINGFELDDTPRVMDRLTETVRLDPRVSEALQALSEERNVQVAIKQLGVSERRLQRLLRAATGRPPVYWKRLARLRQTARELDGTTPLAHLAHDHGYADQAHMNLEFRLWLGLTPRQVQTQPPLLALLAESGHGT